MGIKEQVEFAKEELTQDEKLLAGLIRAEKFYKRNKKAIVALTLLVVVGGVAYGLMDYMERQRLARANEAFLALQKDPADAAALQKLRQENPKLAALFAVKEAIAAGDTAALAKLTGSKDPVVADLAAYHAAAYEKEEAKIRAYRMRTEALLKELALFDEAYLLLKAGKHDEAKKLLDGIEKESPLYGAARMLAHYGIAAGSKG